MKTGLVLEGGGMRGLYTVGVLTALLKLGIKFDYVIGVSAGACNGVSFLSEQADRLLKVNIDYIEDNRYLSVRNLIREKSIFGMDFIFEEIPHKLNPFDYEAFHKNKTEFVVGVTDVEAGKTVYFDKSAIVPGSKVVRASSSIPLFSPIVEIGENKYLDGGTSSPIPVKKAMEDGCEKMVVVLTRERGYVKKPESFKRLYSHMLRKYPKMIEVLNNRHNVYNETLEYIYDLEKQGKVIVIAPKEDMHLSRFEKDKEKLLQAFEQGVSDTKELHDKIEIFVKG